MFVLCLYNRQFSNFLSVDGAHDIQEETETTEHPFCLRKTCLREDLNDIFSCLMGVLEDETRHFLEGEMMREGKGMDTSCNMGNPISIGKNKLQ